MKIVISWIVANICEIFTVIGAIIIGIFAFGHPEVLEKYSIESSIGVLLGGILAFALLSGLEARNNIMGVIILLLHGFILLLCNLQTQFDIIPCVIFAVFGLIVGIYAGMNFYDVVDLRTMYRTSNVDMFESTVRYAINRAIVTFCSLDTLYLTVIVINKL